MQFALAITNFSHFRCILIGYEHYCQILSALPFTYKIIVKIEQRKNSCIKSCMNIIDKVSC